MVPALPIQTLVFRALALCLLSQLVVWLWITVVESASRPGGLATAPSVSLQLAPNWDRDAAGEPILVPLSPEPLYDFEDTSYRHNSQQPEHSRRGIFTAEFARTADQTDLALFFSSSYGLKEVRLNDRLIKAQSPLDPQGSLSGFSPVAYVLPEEFLDVGTNTLTVLSSGRRYKALSMFFVGPRDQLMRAQAWGKLFGFDLVIASTAMMLFVSLLCALIQWPEEQHRKMQVLSVFLFAWSARNLSVLGLFDLLPLTWLRMATYGANFLVAALLLHVAIVWSGYLHALQRYWYGVCATCFGIAVVVLLMGWRYVDWLGNASIPWLLSTLLTLAACVLAIGLLSRSGAQGGRRDRLIVVFLLVCASAMLIDKVDNLSPLAVPLASPLYLTFYIAPGFGLLLALAVCATIAAQSTSSHRLERSLNQRLSQKLSEREQEIRQQAKRHVLIEERARLMRDMHDGLGARLTALFSRVRADQIGQPELVSELSDSIDELRLTVDSLDTQGDSLAFALGAFRARIEPALHAANVDLSWEVQPIDTPELGPAAILHIFRILQEACGNVIRHSGATRVAVRLQVVDDQIVLEIQDNGRGLARNSLRNGGTRHMTERAQQLNGQLRIDDCDGCRVRLTLPSAFARNMQSNGTRK